MLQLNKTLKRILVSLPQLVEILHIIYMDRGSNLGHPTSL